MEAGLFLRTCPYNHKSILNAVLCSVKYSMKLYEMSVIIYYFLFKGHRAQLRDAK